MSRTAQLRRQVAQDAARIMIEEGVHDFAAAKRKAMERLRLHDRACLPDNREVEQAIGEHQAIFHPDPDGDRLRALRESALEAMRFLEVFRPRLVGPLLTGTVGEHGKIYLHLFADHPEAVYLHLLHHGIEAESDERRVRYPRGREERLPLYRFYAGETPIELTVFPPTGLREAPLSPVDGRAQRRASIKELEGLLGPAG